MILNAENVLNFIPSGLGEFGAKAQCGVDLSIKNIRRIKGGSITQQGKEIDSYEEVKFSFNEKNIKFWSLSKGVYSIEFDQSIKLDNKHCGIIISRSTVRRIGAKVESSLFDPGFECPSIGGTMYVLADNIIKIEEHSRVAQFVIFECQESKEYNGSYKGNKDIK